MKYEAGNIVMLYSGETAYVFSVDEKMQQYQVYNINNEEDLYFVSESEIFMLVT